jgi:hypothetical protein
MPLDRRLDVVTETDDSVHMLDGEKLVAEARSSHEFDVAVPRWWVAMRHAWRRPVRGCP